MSNLALSAADTAPIGASAHHTSLTASTYDKRWILLSATLGSAIEWYDFYIFGTAAALVFNKLFFPATDPFISTMASLLTIAVGAFARPVGSLLFGHFGDRIGRKSMLLITMLLMGVPTALIGLLPTYASIGIWAPVLLVTLRIIQGLAIGGEWGGAVLLCVEHASSDRRSFFGSLPQMGTPLGMMLSVAVFSIVSLLPEADFMAWGWRLPFLFSVVLIVFGFAVRRKISESPEFAEAQSEGKIHRVPAIELIKQRWGSVLLAAGGKVGEVTLFYVTSVFLLSYATGTLGLPRASILTVIVIGAAVSTAMMPIWGLIGDWIGARRIYTIGAVLLTLTAVPMFMLIKTGSIPLITIAVVVPFGLIYPMLYSSQPNLYAAQFPPELRYSGVSLGVSIAGAIAGGLAPAVATTLLATTQTVVSVGAYLGVAAIISVISAALMRKPQT